MERKKTICIDFDGVIADYSDGYQGEDKFGDMVVNADIGTQIIKKKGWRIIIYTTRPVTEALKKYLADNKIAYDYINENPDQPKGSDISKGCKIVADVYLDDRAVSFRGNWEWTVNDIAWFQPWSKPKEDMKKKMEKSYEENDVWKRGGEKRIKAVGCSNT